MSFFERFHREAPYLQAYGKLPLAKDYLRVGASQGHGRALREWLDRAYSGSVASKSAAPSLPWPGRFVVCCGAEEPVLGSIWASSDRGGERPFPFALFVERRRKALLSELTEDESALPELWRTLERAYDAHRGAADGESYLAWMRDQELPLREIPPVRSPRVSWDAWVRALWPDEGLGELGELLISLLRLAKLGHRGPLRLPLAQDVAPLPQVLAWWSALGATGVLARAELPTLYFPQDVQGTSEPSFCTFYFRSLSAADAIWIAPKSAHGDLGEGDYTPAAPRRIGAAEPVPQSAPALAESMRGAVASARARAAR
jgi:hypothetical protein